MADLATIPKGSTKAAQAYAAYVALGPDRSLAKLADDWLSRGIIGNRSSFLRQLQQWSADQSWQDRIKALAADQLNEALEYRVGTYAAITKRYHKMVVIDEAIPLPLNALHGIYDRVKPDLPKEPESAGSHVTINFAFVEVTRPE